MKETGTPDDSDVIIPEKAFTSIFPDFGNEVSFIEIKASDGVSVEDLADRIDKTLERVRDDEEFLVRTPESFLEGLTSILLIVQVVLGGIAAISLVVGGIGIANSMFTSVLERTREIGVMKSIGARNSEILSLFLLEAGIVGFFGGIIGVLFGIVISLGIQFGAGLAGIEISVRINPWVIFSALFLAVLIGMISGLVPALQAARQKPVDALRYE